MPIYEFHCPSCNTDFETRVERMGESAPCPRCGSAEVERLLSVSAVHTKGSSSFSSSPCASGQCDFSPSSGPPCCGGGMCGMG